MRQKDKAMTFKPKHGYSVASIFADARNVDTFSPEGFSGLSDGRMEIHIPEPTPSDRRSYSMPARGDWTDCDGAYEYRDSFDPMMNSLWPVDLAYGRGEAEAARLINLHAGSTVLVTIDDETYIAMTSGGMDLSWHIAAAYVCCGCVPPVRILENLERSPFQTSKAARAAILTAWREGARFMASKAKAIRDGARKVAAKPAR